MNCGCPECGALTAHAGKGADIRCVCPACGWVCRDCLGGRNDPSRALTREEARAMRETNSAAKPHE